ncbi:hypothetical protein [Vulcanococcus sp.]|jgi:hypothetical protein|uniref:hypothetical protein n=1 Tax=Vulcanococcus sp. TaxID=2856995 RepID=UPI0034F94EDF
MPPLLPGRSAPRWLAATLQFIGTVAVAIWLVTVLPWLLLFCLLLALLLIPTLRRLRTELERTIDVPARPLTDITPWHRRLLKQLALWQHGR